MPSARTMSWVMGALLSLAGAGCASLLPPPEAIRPPLAIRAGIADMVIDRVEPDVSREEVAAAVQLLIGAAPACFPWPTLWLEGDDRRNIFRVRFDLMTRDWGTEVAQASALRMQDFVDLGFLTRRDRPDLGAGAVEFALTREGTAHLRGSPYGGQRPSFCAPAGRRLLEISGVEWGEFACGSLRVRFTHVADEWPNWARTDAARARMAETWAPLGSPVAGTVSLGRQWFRSSQVPASMSRNGGLRSLCYDPSRERIIGDDLDLDAPME